MINNQINLKSFDFQESLTPAGLQKLDETFLTHLQSSDLILYDQLQAYRQDENNVTPDLRSDFLMACAIELEAFITQLFDIEDAANELQQQTLSHQPIFAFKSYYVLKRARREDLKKYSFNELNQCINNNILSNKLDNTDKQLAIARLGQLYLTNPVMYAEDIDRLVQWCVAALKTPEGQHEVGHWEMFHLPKRLDFNNLIATARVTDDVFQRQQGVQFRHREGFGLTDSRMTQRQVMAEVDYCVYCHKNHDDFCSQGFPLKKNNKNKEHKKNILGDTLTGCPLDEKISEMHTLKRDGFSIAALAMVMINNPMCPVTGHRICNDCMKSCIYQKQEPVNIPQVETRVLTDVLNLPWGVEIYDLLTRWNPLRQTQWVAKPYNGLKVLVMGMGPAGFSLAHHLLMEGFAVVGADGLKIEPLPKHYLTQPIYRYQDITEDLSNRLMTGFGGVAEYGITVRWDKNFLKLIYISLLRRPYFQVFGSIRFGGTLKIEDAWRLGFDHLALAVGAGLPKELTIPSSLAPGMRQANDFLMTLQLTGAAKPASLANLQIRLPAVVIGGGLTAVDTATEIQAYYITQLEKVAYRYQILIAHFGELTVRSRFLAADLCILDEFLQHADELATCREEARRNNCLPDLTGLIHRWGGVTIAYRRTLKESPAYRLNHEELAKAFEEGIYYAEGVRPAAVLLDEWGYVQALQCAGATEQAFPARSIFVATGARLNVAYEFEHRGSLLRADRFEYRRYERVHDHLQQVDYLGTVKSQTFGAFTSYADGHRHVTFLGDTHPVFHGSVVKAIASAQRVYPEICRDLADRLQIGEETEYRTFHDRMEDLFRAQVVAVKRHNPRVAELVVRAPLAAGQYRPGQFYRVQTYGSLSTDALALMGVPHADPELLSFFIIEQSASARLLKRLQPGDPISVMGPTGAHHTRLAKGATVLVVGDVLSVTFVLAMAEELRSSGRRLIYVGYFDDAAEIFCQTRLEEITDQIIWVIKRGVVPVNRPQDQSLQDKLPAVIQQVTSKIEVQQTWLIGASCLLQELKNSWPANMAVNASVYGPMQCMLKGICAQCLQWQLDPATGQRSKAVYACSWQHQPLEKIDITHLDERLAQNRCLETLTNLWMDYLEVSQPVEFFLAGKSGSIPAKN